MRAAALTNRMIFPRLRPSRACRAHPLTARPRAHTSPRSASATPLRAAGCLARPHGPVVPGHSPAPRATFLRPHNIRARAFLHHLPGSRPVHEACHV